MSKKRFEKTDIELFAKALTAVLLPFLLCFVYCLIRGGSLFHLYLPASVNNDCLFYYKLVEGTVSSGIPKGYFGFNESHALIGTYAAWNPFILLPWTIWGKIFGWHYYSVFVSNLFFFSASLCAFVFLAKPEWKNLIGFYVLLFLFPSVPIHILNALPECMMSSALIVYYGFACMAARDRGKAAGIAGMSVLAFFMTVIRPYMVLFFFLPWYFLRKEKKASAWILGISLSVLSVAANLLCSHYLTSEYFTPLYDMTVFCHLFSGQIPDALRDIKYTFLYVFPDIVSYLKGAFVYGLTAGCQYVVALLTAVFLGVCAFLEDAKNRAAKVLHAFTVFALFVAIVFLLQKANEGGRHLYLFAVAGMLLLCMSEAKKVKYAMTAFLAALLIFFLARGAYVPTDYDVPFADETAKKEAEYWDKTFTDAGIHASEDTGYENTVIWVLWDDVSGGRVATDVKGLYALPKGMGISCCTDDYVKANMKHLKSRYIASVPGGETDEFCRKEGYGEIGRSERLVIYER